MPWEDPDKLLRFKFGREEYCQRMLTSLILAAPYPKWYSRNLPSENPRLGSSIVPLVTILFRHL